MKKKNLYIAFLIFSMLAYLIFEWARPQPIDWTESYSGIDKIPYGSYIMRDVLPDLFPGQPIKYQSSPVFDAESAPAIQNVIFINSRFAPDKFEAEKLLKEVQGGKNIFIAAKHLDGNLGDSLGVETSTPALFFPSDLKETEDSVQFSFTRKDFQEGAPWFYSQSLSEYHFTAYDTLSTTVLGKAEREYANYIKINRGQGAFYLHSVPYLFTNFYMRDYHKADYAFRVLSHLPVAPTAWDEYYKAGRSAASSPLRYIVSHRYLQWAWITALVALFLFIIFKAKRRERIIPEMSRPTNTTLEFTRTIGRLYHQSSSHKNLAEKKITYFLKYIRDELNMDTRTIDEAFITKTAQRSGVDEEKTRAVLQEIAKVRNHKSLSSKELWSLNKKIETFYRKSIR